MENYDVIIVGGGTAGALAAVAAGRTGARTLVIERESYLGGTATYGIPFLGVMAGDGTVLHSRLLDELIERLKREEFSPGLVTGTTWNRDIAGMDYAFSLVPFDPEGLKYVLQELCAEAGVEVLYNTVLIGAGVENGRLCSIDVWNKSGKTTYGAKVFVDSTGDADLAWLAGAPFLPKTQVQNSSILFRLGNVDLDKFYQAYQDGTYIEGKGQWHTRILFRDDEKTGKKLLVHMAGHFHLPETAAKITFTAVSHQDGTLFLNATRVPGIDGTDAKQVSGGLQQERRHVMEVYRALRTHVSGFEQAELLYTSPMGIRESRNILGDYVIRREDALSGCKFEDGVAYGAYPIDIHDPKGGKTQFQFIARGDHYSVPYRAMLPQKVEGLLVAGRCISADCNALGTVRIMGCVLAQGDAAGTAAGLCARQNILPRQLDPHFLRKQLGLEA